MKFDCHSYMNLTLELIRIFHATVSDGRSVEDTVEVNRIAMMAGYLIEPMACTEAVFEAMKYALDNYKSTFYKDFKEVLSRTRLDLFVDQMLHYMSTYGTNYRSETFTLNPDPEAMAYKELTPVRAVSADGMFELCMEMINSGSALKLATLRPITDYISKYLSLKENVEKRAAFDISVIPNREARYILYNKLEVLPEAPIEFLALAVYCATGNPMLINSRDCHDQILKNAKASIRCLEMFGSQLTDCQKEGLASIYFRFVDIFVNFKKSFRTVSKVSPKAKAAIKLINYLRHLAPRCKRPFRGDVLSHVLDYGEYPDRVRQAVKEESSPYRLVRVLGYLQMMVNEPEAAQYLIRNGKTFIRDLKERRGKVISASTAQKLIPILKEEIVARLRKNVEGKSVRFPDDVRLAAPTSEKNFVGNFSFMTSFEIKSSAFIGVYWRNEWGTYDFDLSYIDVNTGKKIGWDASFYDKKAAVVFSGDMTNADPEASEILYFRRNVTDGFIFVNRFNGQVGSRFRLFFGKGLPLESAGSKQSRQARKKSVPGSWISGTEFKVNCMDIRLEAELISDIRQQLVGFIVDGCFYFMTLGLGESIVSSSMLQYPLDAALNTRCHSAVDLRNLLIEAGAIETQDSEVKVDIDLTSRIIDRTSLINLFKKEKE